MGVEHSVVSEHIYEALRKGDNDVEKSKRVGINIISESEEIIFVEHDYSDMMDICNVFMYTFESHVRRKLPYKNNGDENSLYRIAIESVRALKDKSILTIRKRDIDLILYYSNIIADDMLLSGDDWYRPFNKKYRENCIKFFKEYSKYAN